MAKDTKQRILSAALTHFNEMGYFNTRLQQIADKANMSVGNMMYHFQDKEALLLILFKKWEVQQQALMSDLHLTPIFENFDNFLLATFQLQQQFRFIYLDQLELMRNIPIAKTGHVDYTQNLQEQLEVLLTLYQARGVLTIPDEQLNTMALHWRRKIDSWCRLQIIEEKESSDFTIFQQYVWSELLPHLTNTGLSEYENRTVLNRPKI